MKKLSDYRIKEVNGNFIIETKIEFKTGVFKKKTQIEWVNACHDGSPFMQFDITCQSSAYYDYYQDNHEIKYKSLNDAKAKIVEWCEKPKYHYVPECWSIERGVCFTDEACKKYDALFLGNYAKCVSDKKGEIAEKYNVPNEPLVSYLKTKQEKISFLEGLLKEAQFYAASEKVSNAEALYDVFVKRHLYYKLFE